MAPNAKELAELRARVGNAGGPLYLGAGTKGAAFAPAEQAVLALGPPRSGKTSTLVVTNVLLAPGPVVSTSTKQDVLDATWQERNEYGRCWLFDPGGTVNPPRGVTQLRWSPVPACRDWETALITARAMVGAARPSGHLGDAVHWTERAEALLAPLLHAAAVTEAGMEQVVKWVYRHDLDTAQASLTLHGDELAADILCGLAATEERELSSIWSTTAGVLAAYRSRVALAGTTDPNFDPHQLPQTTDTIYICASARHQSLVAPLVVGLIEQIRAAAYTDAPSHHSPIALVLDEAANIAPLPDLPSIVAEGGSQGLVTLACFQDLSQARVRWGEAAEGFLSLFGVKVVLPGIGDMGTLELVSRLGGERDVPVRSVSRAGWLVSRPGVTVTSSTRRQRRLPVDAVAQMPAGLAVLIDGAKAPTWLRLTPWWKTPPFALGRQLDRGHVLGD
jgi:type IV secretory pathway TraG/TraD family ATPase VirD4